LNTAPAPILLVQEKENAANACATIWRMAGFPAAFFLLKQKKLIIDQKSTIYQSAKISKGKSLLVPFGYIRPLQIKKYG